MSWNIAKCYEPWRQRLEMDADIALLQEAGQVPADVADKVDTSPVEHWDSHLWNSHWYEDRFKDLFDRWPMVVKLSDRVEVEWFKQVSPIGETEQDEIAVSGNGHAANGTGHAAAPVNGNGHHEKAPEAQQSLFSWAEFLAGELVKPKGRSRKPKSASTSLFERAFSLEQEREEEPVGLSA